MKTLKKLATLSAAVIMAATAAVPATFMTGFAADGSNNITVNTSSSNGVTFSSFNAYQIFAGTYNATQNNFTVTGWGDGIDQGKISDAFNGSTTFAGCSTAIDFADKLHTFGDDSDEAKEFAKRIQKALSSTTSGTYSSSSGTISNVADGYYIVLAGEGTASDNTSTAWSSGLLQVVGGTASVTPKADVASVEKKVFEDSNSTWQDVADAEQGSEVKFRLYAELPSNYAEYKAYYLKFNDELAMPGFKDQDNDDGTYTAVKDDSVKYYLIKNGSTVATDITSTVSSSFTTVLADSNTSDNKVNFSFECKDLKTLTSVEWKIEAGDKIVIEYATELSENAVVTPTTGNDNAVTLTYSNNPNSDYDGSTTPSGDDTGDTPKDEVRVLTYEFDGTKVDGADNAIKLSGAKFAVTNAAGEYATFNESGSITGWVDVYNDTNCLVTSGSNGTFVIKGLDEGTYTLIEKVAPSSDYNLMADMHFTITSTLTAETALPYGTNPLEELTTTLGNADNGSGKIAATIENNKGSSLPGTGGMGTTIFYVGGGILVVASGALLISKKRMKNKEN